MKIAMIELTGKCPRACPTCLPKHLKTGREMMWAEIMNIGIQLEVAGFTGVTFAGFGEPATHPAVEKAIMHFQVLGMKVQVVCRPENMYLVTQADILRVSVQSAKDADLVLIKASDFAMVSSSEKDIRVHVVLENKSVPELGGIFDMLVPWLGCRIKEISVAPPLVLCDDPAHREIIRKANDFMMSTWKGLRVSIPNRCLEKAKLVRLFNPEPFIDKCGFFKGMIYIDSNLKIRPCCHQPLGLELGDLNKQSVCQVLASDVWKNWQATGKKSAACQRCPDLGVSRDG